ncbi:flavodoxin [Kribbella rubisoli]|uniref:Flavodoxin n=1 Tax=Kribbella rubisoli TaxID=3075929 RepID=A0A4Q7WME8_9ACTN|nr:flavodoxin family protein [Kribbella rubisoli]RZU11297.1 flavodoxin [Kribbella rubisoli]
MSETVRALIVYETMFGNTERIARAIRDGLRQYLPAETVPVNRAPSVVPGDVGLLIVGGPTHAFSMSRPSTRQEAWKQGDVVFPIEVGIREWLAVLEPPTGRQSDLLRVATFDTRIAKVRRLPGSAARSAARLLRRMGLRPLSTSESFFVNETTGPISDVEIERAQSWGDELGRLLTRTAKVA